MKIEAPKNNNYCAVVFKVNNLVPLDNCDNVVSTTVFGFQAIVGKDVKVGDLMIVFPAETQLSDEFCHNNNLYRHANKNIDDFQRGYIEENRRVKAVKFRGNTSNCLVMPLDSLKWTRAKIEELREGDEFDNLNGKEICKKYTVRERVNRVNPSSSEKKFVRVDTKHMPEHFDTDNYWKWSPTLDPNTNVIITQKLHGTSIRIGNTICKRKSSLAERVARFFGAKILQTEYDYVYGSRKVVKDINNPNQLHYYDTDLWTKEGAKLQGLLPKGYIVFAELVGWTENGAEIQKDYTYGIPQGQCELYVYRIAVVNEDGHQTDLSWDNIKEFCQSVGLKHVPEMHRCTLQELNIDNFVDKRFFDEGYRNCLSLGDNKDIVDEGVCVRVDKMRPYIMKAKGPKFFEHETTLLDTGTEDLESTQS